MFTASSQIQYIKETDMSLEKEMVKISLETLNKLPKGEFIKTGMIRRKTQYIEGVLIAKNGPVYHSGDGLAQDVELKWFSVDSGEYLCDEPT